MNKPISDVKIKWAMFRDQVSFSSGHTRVPAAAASETMTLTMTEIRGLHVLVVKDSSLDEPAYVPCSNVASFGVV